MSDGLKGDIEERYPSGDVEEFRCLLSFNDDDDGIAFREWWEEVGRVVFNEWLKKHKEERS